MAKIGPCVIQSSGGFTFDTSDTKGERQDEVKMRKLKKNMITFTSRYS